MNKKYTYIYVNCLTNDELIKEYEEKYEKNYQWIGSYFNNLEKYGVLTLYERKKK